VSDTRLEYKVVTFVAPLIPLDIHNSIASFYTPVWVCLICIVENWFAMFVFRQALCRPVHVTVGAAQYLLPSVCVAFTSAKTVAGAAASLDLLASDRSPQYTPTQ
jgi:hypothetical protein